MLTLELTEQEAAYLAWVLANLFAYEGELGWKPSDTERLALSRVRDKLVTTARVQQEKGV